MNAIGEATAGVTVSEMSARKGAVNGSKAATHGMLNGVNSNPVQLKDYATKRRDRWLNRLVSEFLMLDGLYPFEDFLPKENCPRWVDWIQQEYMAATHRGSDVRGAPKLTPTRLGGFLGHQCAFAVWVIENLEALDEDEMKNPKKFKDCVLKKEDYEKGLNILRRYHEWYAALRRLAGRALKSCPYQPYEDMSEFLVAYSSAFSRKPKLGAGTGDFGSTTFEIYHFMLLNWRAVERLDSVRALHDLLRRTLGEFRVGNLKRIEKICQRAGKHFRKPGRPKASK